MTYAVFLQVVRQVSNHDLGLGGNAILGRSALLARAKSISLASLVGVNGHGVLVTRGGRKSLVGGLGQRKDLSRHVGRSISRLGRCVSSLALGVATLRVLGFGPDEFCAL